MYFVDNEHMVEKDSSGNKSHSCLPEHSDFVCTLASSTLHNFFSKCSSADINLEEVRMIEGKKNQVLKLHAAALTGSPGDKKSEAEKFSSLVCQQIRQAKVFNTQKNILVSLCRQLSSKQSPHIEGKHNLTCTHICTCLFCVCIILYIHTHTHCISSSRPHLDNSAPVVLNSLDTVYHLK